MMQAKGMAETRENNTIVFLELTERAIISQKKKWELEVGVGKSGFGSGCSGFGLGFNSFGLENWTQSGWKRQPEPNRTELNSVRFGLGWQFGSDWIDNSGYNFGSG